MKPVRIDFAPRSARRTLFLAGRAAWAAALAALVLASGAACLYWHHGQQRQAFEAELAAARARQVRAQPQQVAAKAAAVTEAEAQAVNAIVMQLNLPWRDLRDAVRAATPAGVALLALEPDARRRSVRLSAEAKTGEDMVAYVERLRQQEMFVAVVLSRHEVNEQDPNRPVRFQVDAQWRPR